MSSVENIRKSLGFFGLTWVGISTAISIIVIFDESKDISELLIVVYLLAFAPLMIVESLLFKNTDRRRLGKVGKVLTFSLMGSFLTCVLFTLGLYLKMGGIKVDILIFIGIVSLFLHILVGIRLPWKQEEWV